MVEDKGVRVLIDPKAVLFLLGTEMDYKTDKLAAQFVFNNPNQTSACGCGELVQLTPAAKPAGGITDAAWRGGVARGHPRAVRRLRPGRVRRMFGGAGIFADGTDVRPGHDGVIYLKADETHRAAFEAEGFRRSPIMPSRRART